MRDFSRIFEAALVHGIKDVAAKLGVTADELASLREIALETGLGFICLDPFAGVRPGTTPGERCDRLQECPDCPLRRFVATHRALMALYLTHRALSEKRDSFESRNPRRWARVWLPWLALTTAVIAKLTSGPLRLKYKRAVAEAETSLEQGTLTLPSIW
jgi:hypothetical protein